MPPTVAGDGAADRNEMVWVILSTVTVCVSLTASQFVSPAFVAWTEQVMPPRGAVRLLPLSVHAPDWRVQDTAPVVCPPVVARDRVVPVVKEAALEITKPLCGALSTVTVVFADCLAR